MLDESAAGMQLVVNGRPVGKPIAGPDFFRALLAVWLGDAAVQADLKSALLGGP
ncbi:MAG: chalcone isomerase family protein [Pseudomonadota bacterium]